MSRECLNYDVVIIGAGPAGLGAAIRLGQLMQASGRSFSVCLLEKGANVGAHTLSGAILDPCALDHLIPDWRARGAPVVVPVSSESFHLLTRQKEYVLPVPPLGNEGCYTISLGALTRWLAQEAEVLGVEIYPGFVGHRLIFSDQGTVEGVITGDLGIGKNGQKRAHFQPGQVIRARQLLLAEGCRGHLTGQVIRRYHLNAACQPPRHGLGVKEIWSVKPEKHRAGAVSHSVGWPLPYAHYGGGFCYHQDHHGIALGLVVGLDESDPHFDPFMAFQRLKTHPMIRSLLEKGTRLGFGARTLSEGGIQSLPKLSFPGGLLLGDGAGLLDVGRMKGIHTALFSGQLAGESVFSALTSAERLEMGEEIGLYERILRQSWLGRALYRSRNVRPGFRYGLGPGLCHGAVDRWLFRGQAPWTLSHGHRSERVNRMVSTPKGDAFFLRPDGLTTFDKRSSLHFAAVSHEEDQPCHIRTDHLTTQDNQWRAYCPAEVFGSVVSPGNCLHCKTCDIRDFDTALRWTPPEGGGGPNYLDM